VYILNSLRVQMNFPIVARGKALDLFDNAKFRAMLPV
jgi:hypothetical protein